MTDKNKLLYIGLNGLAGSGKDTVAKMLKAIMVKDWENIEQAKEFYNMYFKSPNTSATFGNNNPYKFRVYCIAFADQLKTICSTIFGIPVDRFYNNKSNAWICINKDFHYTEVRPDNVISAENYYYNYIEYKNSDNEYYLSLRDVLVYIGTYVLQQNVNKDIFTNIVENTIKGISAHNDILEYIIVTDIRFEHELEYIKNHNGVTIKITNPNIEALDNIAEHSMDEYEEYDFYIENDGTYDELFQNVWDLVHKNVVFSNYIEQLYTRENIDNYIRKIDDDKWELCPQYHINRILHTDGEISTLDMVGGPTIYINEKIPGTNVIATHIEIDDNAKHFIITVKDPLLD